MNFSIRRRIFFAAAGLFFAAVVLQTAWVALSVREEIDEHYDAAMWLLAQSLSGESAPDTHLEDKEDAAESRRLIGWVLTDGDGEIMIRSPGAAQLANQAAGAGFSDVATPEYADPEDDWPEAALIKILPATGWRVYFLPLNTGGAARVIQHHSLRRDLFLDIMLPILTAILWVLPLLLLLLAAIVRRGFSPLTPIIAAANRRQGGDFRPLDEIGAPPEVRGFLRAFNRLLTRAEEAFLREKNFTENAAHELRTPLAAVRAYADNAASAQSETARRQALAGLAAAAAKSGETVEQLLTLARVNTDPPVADNGEQTSLAALCREVVAQFAAASKAADISLQADEDLRVAAASAPLIAVLFRNLLDNAIRHGGKTIIARAQKNVGWTCVSVYDDGPGFTPEFSPRLYEPFRRGESGDESGCGIGLSICKAAADRLGAILEIGNRKGACGARAEVFLPPDNLKGF